MRHPHRFTYILFRFLTAILIAVALLPSVIPANAQEAEGPIYPSL